MSGALAWLHDFTHSEIVEHASDAKGGKPRCTARVRGRAKRSQSLRTDLIVQKDVLDQSVIDKSGQNNTDPICGVHFQQRGRVVCDTSLEDQST